MMTPAFDKLLLLPMVTPILVVAESTEQPIKCVAPSLFVGSFALRTPAVVVPVTVSEVRVPTDVMFGWAFAVTVVAVPEVKTAPTTFAAFMADRPDAGPEKLVAVTPANKVAPETVRAVRVPWLVIAGCAAADTVRALVASGTVPVTFAPVKAERPDAGPEKEVAVSPAREVAPETVRDVRVPWLVMFGCAAAVTVPAVVALVARATVPVTFAPVSDVRAAPFPM